MILTLNAGSSSIKYKLYDARAEIVLAAGLVERIGERESRIRHQRAGAPATEERLPIPDHQAGLQRVVDLLMEPESGVIASPAEITAVGHRVVHGGEKFSAPTRIDAEVLATVEALIPLAPLHNPANLTGIRVATDLFPEAVQVAIFDTAFHQTLPPQAYRYAIPDRLYKEDGIRVYGFHGTSHQYVSKAAAAYLGKDPAEVNLISAHLGNGASMAAVSGGKSVDTSMGFSPLPGLMMGTRSGDIDPAVVFHLAGERGMAITEIDQMLNKQSGLAGIAGSNDLRDIEARMAAGDAQARLAFEMYTYRIRKYIGAYAAALGRVDALVFTAGVGENSPAVRRAACKGLERLGIAMDPARNEAHPRGRAGAIGSTNSAAQILVIPTDEEREIAQQTAEILSA